MEASATREKPAKSRGACLACEAVVSNGLSRCIRISVSDLSRRASFPTQGRGPNLGLPDHPPCLPRPRKRGTLHGLGQPLCIRNRKVTPSRAPDPCAICRRPPAVRRTTARFRLQTNAWRPPGGQSLYLMPGFSVSGNNDLRALHRDL